MIPDDIRKISSAPGSAALWPVAVLWLFPCMAFLIDAVDGVRINVGIGVLGLSTLLAAFDRKTVVLGIPFAAMLGPISGSQPFGVDGLLLSDAFLIIACMIVAAHALLANPSVRFGSSAQYLLIASCLCVLSWGASLDVQVAAKGVFNIMVMGLVYAVTISLVTCEKMGTCMVWSWVIAACYGAVITVVAYTRATPLILGAESLGGQQYAIDMLSLGYLYRATHFYAGFFFVIGTAGVVFLIQAYRGKKKLHKLIALFGLFFTLGVLFLMNTKSAMAGFIALVAIETWRSLFLEKSRGRLARIAFLAIALFGASGAAIYSSLFLVEEGQSEIAIERIGDFESLKVRLEMFKGALELLFSQPKIFLVGLGPDVTLRLAETGNALIDSLLFNPITSIAEGALDSTYITVFMEYGVPLGLLILLFVAKAIALLYDETKKVNNGDLLPHILLAIIVWWIIVALAQRAGTSKPSWLIVQMIAITYSLYSHTARAKDTSRERLG